MRLTKEQKRENRIRRIKERIQNPIFCEVCEKPLLDFRKMHYCSEACLKIGSKRKRQEKSKANKIIEKRICVVCKEEFEVIFKRQKDTCGKAKCKSKNQRDKRKIQYDLMTDDEKKAFRTRKAKLPTQDFKDVNKGQTIRCKCPVCESFYYHTFIPAWIGNGTPRLICEECGKIKWVINHYSILGENTARI